MPPNGKGSSAAKRMLDVLFSFEKRPKATVQDISESADVPLPTAHRYVAQLRELGLIEEIPGNQYRLTMRVVALAQAARSATTLVDLADPYMQELSKELGETVLLVQAIDGIPVCTHRVEAQRRLRLSFQVGGRMPPLRGASAHLLLATYPEEERVHYVKELISQGELTPASSVEEFLEEIQRDGERGWASSHAEIEEGVWSTAAVIREQGKIIGTVSVPCPVFRMNPEVEERHLHAVVDTAEKISSALGS